MIESRNAADEGPDRDWYVVHPAFTEPRLVVPSDWYGIIESRLGSWVADNDEDQHERALRLKWARLCSWAQIVRLDHVRVDDILDGDFDLQELGFDRQERSGRTHWELCADPTAVSSTLRALRDIAIINLTALRGEIELLRVRDHSWDSVFANLRPDELSLFMTD